MLFLKPFKVRSNTLLRENKRRKLIGLLTQTFAITVDNADVIFKNKVVNEVKLHTQTRVDIICYIFDGVPLVFEHESRIFPTVFLLSSLTVESLPFVVTHSDVMSRIYEGSDLMLPGVIKTGKLGEELSNLQKCEICSVKALSGNDGALRLSKSQAIGVCQMSPDDVKTSGGKGRFIHIIHTAQDKLVEMCPPHLLPSYNIFETIECSASPPSSESDPVASTPEPVAVDEETLEPTADELLMICFLFALSTLAESDLPLPLNVFYAKCMKTDCPHGPKLDIKKTSHKKVGVFLAKMAEEGFICLETVGVGINHLVSIRKDHLELEELTNRLPRLAVTDDVEKAGSSEADSLKFKFGIGDFYYGPPVFEEVKIIASGVAPFFASCGYSTGDGITQTEICHIIGNYVNANQLKCAGDLNLIELDGLLSRVCNSSLLIEAADSTLGQPHFQITFQGLVSSLTKGLRTAYRVVFPPESGLRPLLLTDKTCPKIRMYETKQNGKDVTRVSNTEVFGIDHKAFARYLQTQLACSANITTDTRHGNAVSVQTQGHHCVRLSRILTEKFGFPKNWIDGYAEPKTTKKKGAKKPQK